MIVYIKSIKDFSYIAHYETYSFEPSTSDGSMEIYSTDAIDKLDTILGNWCIADGKIYYISEADPDENVISFTLRNPIYAFDRYVKCGNTETTYEKVIFDSLKNDFLNQSDSEYAMPYLSITHTESTKFTPDPDTEGYIQLSSVMEEALGKDVLIEFTLSGTNSSKILVTVKPVDYAEAVIIIGDGHHWINDESYSDERIAKLTLIQSASDSDSSSTTYTYYYGTDGKAYKDSPPSSRASGKWGYATCSSDDDPETVALDTFEDAELSHKIEFYSDKVYYYKQKIKIKVRNQVYTSVIEEVSQESGSSVYLYTCGTMATTLVEKIQNGSK